MHDVVAYIRFEGQIRNQNILEFTIRLRIGPQFAQFFACGDEDFGQTTVSQILKA